MKQFSEIVLTNPLEEEKKKNKKKIYEVDGCLTKEIIKAEQELDKSGFDLKKNLNRIQVKKFSIIDWPVLKLTKSADCALLFSYIFFKSKYNERDIKNIDVVVKLSQTKIESDISLSPYRQRVAYNSLDKAGLVSIKIGVKKSRVNEYKINLLRLVVIHDLFEGKREFFE